MKIARYLAHGQVSYGVVEGGMVKELSASPFEPYQVTDHTHPVSEVKLLAPCAPTKILAIGLNYSSHLHDREAPAEPIVFYKTPTSVIGPDEVIVRPKATEKLDAEAELVVVIKDRCRNVAKEQALQRVLGYTCGNDVSARDWQRDDRNWWRAKSADTFSPRRALHRNRHRSRRRAGCLPDKRQRSARRKHQLLDLRRPHHHCLHVQVRHPGAGGHDLHRHSRGTWRDEGRRRVRGRD